jgi:hypothetical protein
MIINVQLSTILQSSTSCLLQVTDFHENLVWNKMVNYERNYVTQLSKLLVCSCI